MPNKLPSFDRKLKNKMDKIKQINPGRRITSEKLEMARKFRHSHGWTKLRNQFIKREPLCFDPFKSHERNNRSVAGQQVHHIYAVASHYELRFRYDNLASLCTSCHARIEQMERAGKPTQHFFKVDK